jgi:mxaA protein
VTLLTAPSRETLPQPGRIDNWLELREAAVDERTLILTYQLMNAPLEVKTLQLPPVTLDLGASQAAIPEWPFTASPLTPQFVLAREGLAEVRPDVSPRPIATRGIELRLLCYAVALAALLLWWAYRKFGWRVADRPFSRAYRTLRSLRAKGSYQAALKIVHRAFDETAGRALFARELPGFLSQNPRFAAAGDEARKFFLLSEHEFFAADAAEPSFEWLVSFCRTLSRLEAK